TTGDGYGFVARFGHTIVTPRPALVPITVNVPWVPELRGVTLPDVAVRVVEGDEPLASRRGSLLIARFRLSRPVILDVSRAVSGHLQLSRLCLGIDLFPGLNLPQLDEQLRQAAGSDGRKQLAAVLAAWLPRRLCDAVLVLAGLAADRKAAGLRRADR